jgi:hypothetical protein
MFDYDMLVFRVTLKRRWDIIIIPSVVHMVFDELFVLQSNFRQLLEYVLSILAYFDVDSLMGFSFNELIEIFLLSIREVLLLINWLLSLMSVSIHILRVLHFDKNFID